MDGSESRGSANLELEQKMILEQVTLISEVCVLETRESVKFEQDRQHFFVQ